MQKKYNKNPEAFVQKMLILWRHSWRFLQKLYFEWSYILQESIFFSNYECGQNSRVTKIGYIIDTSITNQHAKNQKNWPKRLCINVKSLTLLMTFSWETIYLNDPAICKSRSLSAIVNVKKIELWKLNTTLIQSYIIYMQKIYKK